MFSVESMFVLGGCELPAFFSYLLLAFLCLSVYIMQGDCFINSTREIGWGGYNRVISNLWGGCGFKASGSVGEGRDELIQ